MPTLPIHTISPSRRKAPCSGSRKCTIVAAIGIHQLHAKEFQDELIEIASRAISTLAQPVRFRSNSCGATPLQQHQDRPPFVQSAHWYSRQTWYKASRTNVKMLSERCERLAALALNCTARLAP